jgi:uncharacterized protein
MPNRLARETSPYLLQHRDNPVDWFPWGPEALERARAEDRPILLSVGYSACHWCHVMEHESFADAEIAAVMNEHFVNIKVDREERPDVDSLYMEAVQQMTGHGGWPMTVFLTPEGEPFYGGTYYPPTPRHGLPSFRQVLLGVHDAWTHRRDQVRRSAGELRAGLERGLSVNPEPGRLDESLLQRAFHRIASRFDARWGGFGEAPKFPQPMTLELLLRHDLSTGAPEAVAMVERSLTEMANGGMYDHLGGGFHRYSVDARWLVPHFEKMLYDNALLSRVYLHGYQVTGRVDFLAVVEEVLGYVTREMTHSGGGFFSSQDADSEGVEGKFYVWSPAEIDEALGPEHGLLFRLYYGVGETGNWEGSSILNVPRPAEVVAAEVEMPVDRLLEIVSRGRTLLYEIRSRRIPPARDEKIVTSWNALMLHSYAEAGRVLDRADLLEIAVQNAEFLLGALRTGGRLKRTWRDGTARIDAFLEDHATLLDALVEVYFATFDLRWIDEARWMADRVIDLFWSEEEGVFYDTARDAESLVIRPRAIYDNATPSGTSAAVRGLMRLARLVGEVRYERVGTRVMESLGEVAAQVPQGFGHLLCSVSDHLRPPLEIVVVGDPGSEDTRALLAPLRRRFLPGATFAMRPPDAGEEDIAGIPLLAGRTTLQGRATAYVCRRYTCRRPVDSAGDLEREIEAALGREG